MDAQHGFSDSDDELSGSYSCSDPEDCDRGADCDGDHTYSLEYLRSRLGQGRSEDSEDRTVDGKPRSDSHAVVDDCEGDKDSGEAPPSDLFSDSGDDAPKADSGDEPKTDCEDACSSS